MTQKIVRHTELEVYKKAFNCATEIFELSKKFPREEMYSLTDQIRRSSRSVCANLAEAWRKRRYETAFISKLTECEGEAAETQTWIEFAVAVGYLDKVVARKLYEQYDEILITFASMINHSESWILTKRKP
ncbi:MAG: four helix bundle protein [Anaerolineae bacterium]